MEKISNSVLDERSRNAEEGMRSVRRTRAREIGEVAGTEREEVGVNLSKSALAAMTESEQPNERRSSFHDSFPAPLTVDTLLIDYN
ncbi:hypothetical protein Scep_023456 [Stephania cephalantha]|uniref:Uncharacterized protein n=1 Tax=Stephania cephalantha TaxID=152367 RepID=A0AAP0EUQ5_9MAGN